MFAEHEIGSCAKHSWPARRAFLLPNLLTEPHPIFYRRARLAHDADVQFLFAAQLAFYLFFHVVYRRIYRRSAVVRVDGRTSRRHDAYLGEPHIRSVALSPAGATKLYLTTGRA